MISIHSLRVEGDAMIRDVVNRVFTFQSTPSVWRETNVVRVKLHSTAISIHSLRVEGDTWFYGNEVSDYDFNPLPPCGGRRVEDSAADSCIYISIHSLRVEGDARLGRARQGAVRFQSTPSVWRETRFRSLIHLSASIFQSTPSVWRETLMILSSQSTG